MNDRKKVLRKRIAAHHKSRSSWKINQNQLSSFVDNVCFFLLRIEPFTYSGKDWILSPIPTQFFFVKFFKVIFSPSLFCLLRTTTLIFKMYVPIKLQSKKTRHNNIRKRKMFNFCCYCCLLLNERVGHKTHIIYDTHFRLTFVFSLNILFEQGKKLSQNIKIG